MVSFILPGNSASGGYEVANSLRFNRGSSDYLSKTFGTPTSTKKGTHSVWFKLSNLQFQNLIGLQDGSTGMDIGIDSSHRLNIFSSNTAPSTVLSLDSTQVLRDPSAWYHVVVAIDTTQATASNRVKVYLNGTQITAFATETYPSLNDEPVMCLGTDNTSTFIGASPYGGGANFLDGYIAEYVYVDGSQLDADQFGEFDSDTNIWKPIDVSGLTFGNNGFYLDFEDSSALGDDVSGNGNDFTVNNLTSIDQTTDTCTNNFATFNPLVGSNAGGSTEYYGTFTEGNTYVTGNAAQNSLAVSTIGVSQGKWYAEFILISESDSGAGSGMGVTDDLSAFQTENVQTSSQIIFDDTGQIVNRGTGDGGSNTFSTGDVIGVALDLDNNFVYFSINGTFINSGNPTSGSSGTGGTSLGSGTDEYFFFVGDSRSGGVPTFRANFGNPSASISSGNSDGNGYGNFEYSVPSGYYSLCTKNLAEYG